MTRNRSCPCNPSSTASDPERRSCGGRATRSDSLAKGCKRCSTRRETIATTWGRLQKVLQKESRVFGRFHLQLDDGRTSNSEESEMKSFNVKSTQRTQFIEITDEVRSAIK